MDTPVANALERIRRNLWLLLGRGRIKTGDDSGGVQQLQVQLNDRETRDNTPRVAEYGFASMPLPGCQAILVFVGGERSNAAIIGTNDEKNRLKGLQPGEVAIYDDQGQYVWIKRGGIEINCAGKPLNIINCPSIHHDGVNIGNTHTHPVRNVTPGSSTVESDVPQ
jgi:phage baseplate assembly protein V